MFTKNHQKRFCLSDLVSMQVTLMRRCSYSRIVFNHQFLIADLHIYEFTLHHSGGCNAIDLIISDQV